MREFRSIFAFTWWRMQAQLRQTGDLNTIGLNEISSNSLTFVYVFSQTKPHISLMDRRFTVPTCVRKPKCEASKAVECECWTISVINCCRCRQIKQNAVRLTKDRVSLLETLEQIKSSRWPPCTHFSHASITELPTYWLHWIHAGPTMWYFTRPSELLPRKFNISRTKNGCRLQSVTTRWTVSVCTWMTTVSPVIIIPK